MRFLSLVLLAFCSARAVLAKEAVSIAAAADLVFCLEKLNAAFSRTHPDVELKVATGSSGNFYAQIVNGAPFDVFLSADVSYPRALIEAGSAAPGTLTSYAIGRIVLWTRRDDLDLSAGVAVVAQPAITRLAIANPDHAPYGRAAREALQHAGCWAAVQPRLVFGENIAQAAQFVETGNADAGIVALSLVLSPRLKNVGHYVEIPADAYAPLEQAAVLTTRGAANPLAQAYLVFLRSAEARTVFDECGFRLPN